jgi:hypothetical protein
MAENNANGATLTPQGIPIHIPTPGYYQGNSPTYGSAGQDGTFFNEMLNVPNPSLLAKELTEHAGRITREMNEESKRSQRESAEISKATLANRMYISMQQAAVSLAKEAIEVTKQA